jgi:hypothetical protein
MPERSWVINQSRECTVPGQTSIVGGMYGAGPNTISDGMYGATPKTISDGMSGDNTISLGTHNTGDNTICRNGDWLKRNECRNENRTKFNTVQQDR